MSLYHLGNARSAEQRARMARLEAAGVCLFCPEHLSTEQEVVGRTSHWAVTANRYPYRGTRLHLLLVPRQHVPDLLSLPEAALADFWAALRWVADRFGLTFYGLGARCGDCRYTGGTIEHVHVHVIVGDVDDPAHEPVRMKLSSRPSPSGPSPSG